MPDGSKQWKKVARAKNNHTKRLLAASVPYRTAECTRIIDLLNSRLSSLPRARGVTLPAVRVACARKVTQVCIVTTARLLPREDRLSWAYNAVGLTELVRLQSKDPYWMPKQPGPHYIANMKEAAEARSDIKVTQ